MDPALRELMRRVRSPSDEVSLIVRLADPAVDPPQARVVARFGDVVTVRVSRAAIEALWTDTRTVSVKAPHAYAPDVMPETVVEGAEAYDDTRHVPSGLTGRGTVVGVVDWGLDVAHPDFRSVDGSTRLLGLWDQRVTSGPAAEPYGYGRAFGPDVINSALATSDPYRTLGYHPAEFDTGSGAHGTHTFSIAAGNGRAGGPPGVAPEASGVFVNLGSAEGPVPLGSSTQLLESLDYIRRLAGSLPLIVNFSLGRHAGQHKGRSLVERAFDHFVSAAPGRAIVQSAGNYFERQTHGFWQLSPGDRQTFTVEIDPADRTANTIDIWYPGRDRLTVEVINTDLNLRARVPIGGHQTLTDSELDLVRVYHRAGDPNTGDNQCSVIIEPTERTSRWEVALHGDDVVDGRVHVWIERDTGCRTCQSHLGTGQADRRTTTGTIANGFRTIVVGAVNGHRAGTPMAGFSSSGPTRDARRKPDLVAPGVLVLGARSTPRDRPPGAGYVRMSGSSMAAPAVAGTVALMFQRAGALPIQETRRALLSSCDPLPDHDPMRSGAGLLNSAAAVAAVEPAASRAPIAAGGADGGDAGAAAERSGPQLFSAAETVPLPSGPLRVAVVGGGLSGLMAASSLQGRLFSVTVFEATERLGGRVHTRRDLVPGKTVEAGAELVGTNHPLCNGLARQFGIRPSQLTEEEEYESRNLRVRWLFGGRSYGRTARRAIRKGLIVPLQRIGEEARTVDPRQPWAAARAAEWDAMSVAARLRRPDLALDPIRRGYLELVLANDQCRPTAEQSYLGLLSAISAHRNGSDMLGYWLVTETHRFAGGNDQLVRGLAARLSDVRTGAPVRNIEVSDDGVRVGFDRGKACHAEDFDFVVLAAPSGVWPSVVSDAEPFRAGDYAMATGPAVKHLNTFVRRFWEDRGLAPSALTDRIGSVWESTDRQRAARQDRSEPSGFGLSVYSGGPYVRDAATYQAALQHLYPGYRTQVRRSELVDWPQQPFIGTGYSVPAVGQVTTVARRLSGSFRGRLFFAGEQASPGFFGYMEGALQAGASVSRSVAAAGRAQLAAQRGRIARRTVLVPSGAGGGGRLAGSEEIEQDTRIEQGGHTEHDKLEHDERAEWDAPEVAPCAPAAEPGPPGGPPHPVIRVGSRRPAVGHAQNCLNRFLAEIQSGTRMCRASGAEPAAFIQRSLTQLAGRGQLPLAVDCAFGGATEIAVKAVQACFGLSRDGVVGKDTWPVLDSFLLPATSTAYQILVDGGRSGSLSVAPTSWTWGAGGTGAVVLVNNDDDDNDDRPDNENSTVETADASDLAPLVLELVGTPDPSLTLELTVSDPASLRVFERLKPGATEIIGPARGATHRFAAPVPGRLELAMEGVRYARRGFSGEVMITARWTTAAGPGETRTMVRVAPWLVSNHLDRAEVVHVVDAGSSNATFRAELGRFVRAAGCRLAETTSDDIWMQDCMEFGYASVPTKRLRTVLQMLRGGSLRTKPRLLLGPDCGFAKQGRLLAESSMDFGGNLECSPPVTVRGRRFPAGRIYLGTATRRPFDPEVREFLEQQVVQRPIEVDSSWLAVGHVDEVLTFVPAPDRQDFRMLVASPRRAYTILDRLSTTDPAARILTGRTLLHAEPVPGDFSVERSIRDFLGLRAAFHPDIATAAAPPGTLRTYNMARQADIDRMRTRMITGLGLDGADVIELPAVFMPSPLAPTRAEALVAGMVNMLVINGHCGVPAPFGPVVGGVDQFEQDVRDQLTPLGVQVTFLDCWDPYHVLSGEVHCGTNTVRTAPALTWWEFRP